MIISTFIPDLSKCGTLKSCFVNYKNCTMGNKLGRQSFATER
jgi:hypothetical protein